jgi:hypothetical protein
MTVTPASAGISQRGRGGIRRDQRGDRVRHGRGPADIVSATARDRVGQRAPPAAGITAPAIASSTTVTTRTGRQALAGSPVRTSGAMNRGVRCAGPDSPSAPAGSASPKSTIAPRVPRARMCPAYAVDHAGDVDRRDPVRSASTSTVPRAIAGFRPASGPASCR